MKINDTTEETGIREDGKMLTYGSAEGAGLFVPMTVTLTANNQTLTLSAPASTLRRWTWPEDAATEATLREEIDERVEDLIPSLVEAPSGERVLELAEQLSDVCPWLRSLGLERVSDAVVRVAGRRVSMVECEPW